MQKWIKNYSEFISDCIFSKNQFGHYGYFDEYMFSYKSEMIIVRLYDRRDEKKRVINVSVLYEVNNEELNEVIEPFISEFIKEKERRMLIRSMSGVPVYVKRKILQ